MVKLTYSPSLPWRARVFIFFLAIATTGFTTLGLLESAAAKATPDERLATESRSLERESAGTTYRWNVDQKDLPLLGLAQEHLNVGFDQSLTYPTKTFDFLIFKALQVDETNGNYSLPALASDNHTQKFIEFVRGMVPNTYLSNGGIELVDKDGLKIVRTSDGTKYFFVRYPDDEFRCATIKEPAGGTLNLLYTANGLALHGVVDSFGRRLMFNYGEEGIESVTQTWTADSRWLTKTWTVGEAKENVATRYAHATPLRTIKLLPPNALIREYTDEMAASDELLAHIFGGPTAVVGGNGFEPAGLAAAYPLYRGDIRGDDGKIRLGHLSHALHIYGTPDGTGESALYVPAGFTSHSVEPSPTDAALLFYYPKLGNLTDVTLAVFHVKDFNIVLEGERVRIGNLGGPGGSTPHYKHSHIEFYRGHISGVPSASARPALRIDPATVFTIR